MPFVFGWLLNGAYLLILMAVAPVLVYRRVMHGKYRRGWREKLTGRLIRRHPEKRCLWFHAVSVGEVLQLQKVLEETEARFPDAELFLTVTTETGYDVALTKYPRYTVSFFPLDFRWAVNTALSAIRPDLIVLVELELWPNLIFTARRRQIPLVLINGRMGEKSFRGYSRLKPLMQRLLSCFDVLAVQTETYGNRLKSLGAPADHVIVTGNIKFDRVESDRNNPKTTELRSSFKLSESDLVFIAGSTQDPEEAYAMDAWLVLRIEFPHLQLIIVPRHKERFDEVAALIRQRGCEVIRRSEMICPTGVAATAKHENVSDKLFEKPVVALLDTLGELAACWGLADIAFVGGSLTNRGGQNMIEPAGYGVAVLFGPNTWNFKDVTEALLSQGAARVITGPDQLRDSIRQLLQHPDEAKRLGQAARSFVATQHGATQRTVDLLAEIVRGTGSRLSGVGSDERTIDQIANIVRDQPSNPLVRDKSVAQFVRPNWYWPILKWVLFAIAFVFVGRRAVQLWESAPPKTVHIKWLWLFAAALFYFVGWLPSVWFWKALLKRLRQPLDWWTAFRAYYVSHLGKYIPGKALVLVIRGSMVKDAGVNPMLGGVTAAYETLVFMATGTAICLAISPFAYRQAQWDWLPTQLNWIHDQPLLMSLIVVLITFATTPASAWLFSRIGRKALSGSTDSASVHPTISAGLISLGVAITSLGWVCHALSLGCVLQAVSDDPIEISQFPIWLGSCTLATVGGFVALFAPGGLGVREELLMEALKNQPQIGPASAVIVAGLLRAVWFVTELIAAAILFTAKPNLSKPKR